ncbi:MAG TPA: SpoIIE family protein phosphatase [Actinomycetes bacterium]|jgi:serine phosphatase RsbU (regulator of sigma subunit)/anti-sigma regulatory factor (Ser/Thr protein kinase)|nr:SpoIIE family protein phosphatase [Actinomycetes bacterium]
MTMRSRKWKWMPRREPAARPEDGAEPQAAPVRTDVPELGVAPNDPLIAYFQTAGGVVDLDALELESPALAELRESGMRLVVPLINQGELLGLLNLGPRRSEQDYSADDRKLLSDLAGHAAPAIRVAQLVREQQAEVRQRERIEQELKVAQLIQQQFLPRELPDLTGWHVAAYYQPARAVGGDFYDFIPLPDGQIGIVVGDVTDKGVPAALVMATTHAILRAEAPRLVAPAEVLEHANNLLVEEMPAHMFVTCLYAVLDPSSGRLRFANAGHNLPYLRGEGGVAELRATGMPLGLLPGMRYEEKEIGLAAGDSLLLHSDGLAEAHGPDREMFGFPRLAKLAGDRPAGEELIDLLLAELARFTGPGWEQEDDITLVTLRRTAGEAAGSGLAEAEQVLAEFEVPSAPGNERIAIDRVAETVQTLSLSPPRLERLKTAVGEATMNAIEHGNGGRPEFPVEVRVAVSAADLTVRITDHGGGKPIPEAPTPDLEAKLAGEQSARGWGLFLIKNMVDELRTSSDGQHHVIELVMHLPHAERGTDHGGS